MIERKFFMAIIPAILIILFVGLYFYFSGSNEVLFSECGDGTLFGECSVNNPYYCEEGILVEKASLCGCPDILSQDGDSCISEYATNPKEVLLEYFTGESKGQIDFIVYEGLSDYLYGLPNFIKYEGNESPDRGDFKIRDIEEENQRELLLPLVIKIQNLAQMDKSRQARIAISLVQNIKYGYSGKTKLFIGSIEVPYSRYPNDVLYDGEGICGEKSELLAFLLKELGYGITFFYYSDENHEAIGIKCPVEHSLNGLGYCFVETTGPAILTDNKITYVGGVVLPENPESIIISEGISLPENLPEYKDARDLIELREEIENNVWVFPPKKWKFEKLVEKYGLVDEYNLD